MIYALMAILRRTIGHRYFQAECDLKSLFDSYEFIYPGLCSAVTIFASILKIQATIRCLLPFSSSPYHKNPVIAAVFDKIQPS